MRPYYVFTAIVFGLGMVASVFIEEWGSFFVFAVLCLTFVAVALRVDRDRAPAQPAGEPKARVRPSERRRQRKSQG